jgi:flagellar basal body-associated protein FliL
MMSKSLYAMVLVLFLTSVFSQNCAAQSDKNATNALIATAPSNPTDKVNALLSQVDKATNPSVPQISTEITGVAELPKVPKFVKVPDSVTTQLPNETKRTLETLETMKEVDRIQQTLETLKSLDKFQLLGTFIIELKNSESYTSLTVGISAIVADDDIEANLALLEKHNQMLVDTLQSELSVLTDKELAWEQESRNVLKSVRKKINTVAKKKFIADLFYNEFELTAKTKK